MIEPHANRRTYLIVFVGIAVLTAIELTIATLVAESTLRIILLLIVTAAKAALVALFYMHLRYDQPILAVIAGFPLLLVAVMIVFMLADRSLGG